MDEFSGKRAENGLISKKGSGLVLRETPNRDRNAQLCSRLGCSGRLNSVKSAQVEKAKPSRPTFRSSSSGKEIIGSSSRSCIGVGNTRNSIAEPYKKLSSNLDTDSSETSSVQDDPEVSEITPPPGKIQRGLHLESKNSVSSEITLMEVGSSPVFNQRSGLRSPDSIVGSSVSTGPKSTIQTRASTARNGLRSLRCSSVSDVAPSSCSSSDSSLGRRETIKKRTSEGESSSAAKGKKMNGSSSAQNSNSSHGISISDSRRARNMPSNRDNNGVASVRTRRTVTGHSRGRLLPHQGSGNNSSSNGFSAVGPHTSQPEMSINSNASTSSQQLSAEVPLIRQNSYSRPGSSSGTLHGILRAGASDVGFSRSLMNQDGLRRYNMDGIAEVLLALERIEHDEELSFEQILVLETNLFLNSLNIYDHHRDMRLDIDNMTYEVCYCCALRFISQRNNP
ncbi:E3 ubiquitin-protein ligase MBR2-like [Pyrus ussuriensis x Pyrus communis]|uniref:E3 ubiquitin-protein ligase MBR2-like n=1 Tax=Pyrus ussuriensis x Pyrus communis TaxID=2448454 RepID=A0A5N5GZH4_9ROSA|nr:E3 ubiquitin-protein ligase MBR2-like [Pyrus ussuriensis x Pyrus communis]